jgi:hypothetical protein
MLVISWVWDANHKFQSWMMRKFTWDYFRLRWINMFCLIFKKDWRVKGRVGSPLILKKDINWMRN